MNVENANPAYRFRSEVLDNLGVRSWINAKNWSTDIGGNTIDERVLTSMGEVALTFVDMHELMLKAGQRVAGICRADEAQITTGASGAIELAVAGCMAGDDDGIWARLPMPESPKNEVLLARGHYINYSPQWTASGGKIVEYGISGTLRSSRRELKAAISAKTCCLAYTFSYNNVPRGILPFEEVVEAGRDFNIPVIVDAASELPPVENLHRFLDLGADVVCFSGGKAIRGPNNTGFMAGRAKGNDIIKNIRAHTFPHHGWARGHKLSKEQIVGLVTALEIFIKEGDHLYEGQLEVAETVCTELSALPHLNVSVMPNNEKLHEHPMMPHVPRVLMTWNASDTGFNADDLDRFMAESDPPVALRNIHYYNYYTNDEWRLIDTFFLRQIEVEIVIARIKECWIRNSRKHNK